MLPQEHAISSTQDEEKPTLPDETSSVVSDTEATPEDEKLEEQAGTYVMLRFQSPTSILYQRVFSKEGPHPLAYAAILRKELADLETAMSLDVEMRIIGAAQQAQAPVAISCRHCGAPQPEDNVLRVAQNKVAFCAKCHQKL